MTTKTITINEFDLEIFKSKSLILRLIDDHINNCNIQFLQDWEKNHSISSAEKSEKVKALEAKKEEIKALFENCKAKDSLVDFNISIDLTVKNTENIAV
jgi:hypothetical protein